MTTTKPARAAIYASAKVAEIKPKENQYGANTFRVSLDLELKKPEPVLDFKGWKNRYVASWDHSNYIDQRFNRWLRENTTTEGEGDKAKEKKPPKAEQDSKKQALEAEYEESLGPKYEQYQDKARKELQAALSGALSSGMFMLLLGQKVDVRITPAQGQLLGGVFGALSPRSVVTPQLLEMAGTPQPDSDEGDLEDEDDEDFDLDDEEDE